MKKILALLLILTCITCIFTGCNGANDMEIGVGNDFIMEDMDTSSPSMNGSINLGGNTSTKPNTGTTNDTNSEYASKIIKKYYIESETKEFDEVLKKVISLIEEYEGYIENSSITGNTLYNNGRNRRYAKYIIRVPADNIEVFVEKTSSMLNITSSSSSAENITSTYYDLQSRLNVLEAEKIALTEMLEKASNVDTMLRIRDQLNNVISDIESIKTQLKVYDSLVSYSTITLTIEEVIEYTEVITEEPSWGSRMVNAFKKSWSEFAENFQDFTVFVVYAMPTIITLAVIGGVTATILILVQKKRKKK
jgi:hypothetical protein